MYIYIYIQYYICNTIVKEFLVNEETYITKIIYEEYWVSKYTSKEVYMYIIIVFLWYPYQSLVQLHKIHNWYEYVIVL